MDALALVLIRLDITPSRLNEVSRASFVKAAASANRKRRSGRPHVARIASLTGLSRAEVKRILDSDFGRQNDHIDHLPRTLRVLAAWKTARKYAENGKPRSLRVSGGPPSFEILCREFGGDIPHKAILAELEARRLVKVELKSGVATATISRRSLEPETAAMDVLRYAGSVIESLTNEDRLLLKRHVRTASPVTIASSYFEKSVTTRLGTIVDELPARPKRSQRASKSGDELEVFAIVSRRRKDK